MHHRPALSPALLAVLVVGCALVGCAAPSPRPAAEGEKRLAYAPLVLTCAPAEVPASLMAERSQDAERAQARFSETRGVVLLTLNLYLGTARWASTQGARVPVNGEKRLARDGTEEECRALRATAAGRTPPSWPMTDGQPLAVAGVVSLAYLPGAGAAPQLLVRLAALLVDKDGGVLRAAAAEATAAYATQTPRYEERNPQEVAQEIMERAARALAK